jgi:two-component system KDP operon response regulator KdpE
MPVPRDGGAVGGREGPRAGVQVLVVDDDPPVRDLVSRWLNRSGYTVAVAGSFREAVALLPVASPHALVIDVRLGDFNGLQLALQARRWNPHARIVMISGWDDPVLRREADACQAGYLCKPFTADALLNALAELPQALGVES